MKLQQGQLWKKGDDYFRIVEWSREAIVYKAMKDSLGEGAGNQVEATKKEFCRLIKGGDLVESS
jgi:hypothetical protein